MDETLQELFRRRQRELGSAGKPMPIAELARRTNGLASYETIRKVEQGSHTTIGDEVADGLSLALDVPVSQVLRAAGQRQRRGRFDLPRRADRLTDRERRGIVEIVDLLLEAGEQGSRDVGGTGRRTGKRDITGWRKSEQDEADEG